MTENPNAKAPKVSVIVPNYNHSKFLRQRLDSIFGQTFTDFEVILLDDASTDQSVEILKEYAEREPRVTHLIVNEENSGSPFRQWKRGLDLARGEYIWIAETDDFCLPGFLERSVKEMDAHPKAALSFVGCNVFDSEGYQIGVDYNLWLPRMADRMGQAKCFDGMQYLVHNMVWHCKVYNASAVLFRRSVYSPDAIAPSLKMRNGGDYMFWCHLAAQGDVIEIYERLNCYRLHGSNTTGGGYNNGNLLLEDIDVLKYIFDTAPISEYRKRLRLGLFWRRLQREAVLRLEMRPIVEEKLRRVLGFTMADHKLERRNKFLQHICPWVLRPDNRDRL